VVAEHAARGWKRASLPEYTPLTPPPSAR
jgi:hypothetical protein